MPFDHDLSRYDGSKPEPPYRTEAETVRADTIDECIAEALKHDSVIDVVNALTNLKN